MAIKKSEIYSQIWAACDKLRGGVEPARYKDYILRRDLSRYVFAKECAIRIDKQQKECYNNAVIDNDVII